VEARSMVNHWVEAPEWLNGRQLWAFYLTFAGASALHDFAAAHQSRLAGIDGLDLVDRRWLHVTIQGAAFTDQIDPEAYQLLVRAVAQLTARERAIDLVVQRPRPARDAVWMQAIPSHPLDGLRDRLRSAATAVLGTDELYALPEPVGGFNPHITVAYVRPPVPQAADITAALEDVALPDIRVRAPHLSLVRLSRGSSEWTWDAEERFPLSGGVG